MPSSATGIFDQDQMEDHTGEQTDGSEIDSNPPHSTPALQVPTGFLNDATTPSNSGHVNTPLPTGAQILPQFAFLDPLMGSFISRTTSAHPMGEVSGSYHPVAFRQPYLGPLALLPNFNPETFSQQSAPALGLPMNPLTPTSLASRTSVQENQSTYGSTEEDGGSEEIKKSKRARKSMDLTAYLLDGGVHPPDYSNFPLNFKSHHHAWESCAEELAQAKGAWMQPQNDDTIPETQEDRENVVSQLLGAMVDMSYSEDKDSRVNKARWTDGNAAYDIKQLEKCCWDIAMITERYHREGPHILTIFDTRLQTTARQARHFTFGQRIELLKILFLKHKNRVNSIMRGNSVVPLVAAPQDTIRSTASNLVQNKKRQEYLKKGRKAHQAVNAEEDVIESLNALPDTQAQSHTAPSIDTPPLSLSIGLQPSLPPRIHRSMSSSLLANISTPVELHGEVAQTLSTHGKRGRGQNIDSKPEKRPCRDERDL